VRGDQVRPVDHELAKQCRSSQLDVDDIAAGGSDEPVEMSVQSRRFGGRDGVECRDSAETNRGVAVVG
jgi:hypothetical protein